MLAKTVLLGVPPVAAAAGALQAAGSFEGLLVLFTVAPVALFGVAAWARTRRG